MLHSAEIRWFVEGALPEPLRQWFCAGRNIPPEGSRTDEYLVFPGCDVVGVKLRQGKLEIKARSAPPRALDLGAVRGRTDRWVKWSFGSKKLKELEAELRQSGRWLNVSKERFLRKFSADSGIPTEVAPDAKPLPTASCNVELTRIEADVKPRRWFTIGFEAFGPSNAVPETLEATVRQFFGEHGPPPGVTLAEAESFSYPAWLAELRGY